MKTIKSLNIPNILLWLIWPAMPVLLPAFMFVTCGNKVNGTEDTTRRVAASVCDSLRPMQKQKTFPMAEVPAMLSDPQARAAYLASHYWDKFDFSDTSYIHLPEVTEQAFVNFLSVLPHSGNATAASAIKGMLQQSITRDQSGKFYSWLLDKYKYYLSDPNSPLRNEELYMPVTEFILSDSLSNEADKSRADFDRKMMLKNRVGTKATDFAYQTIGGKNGKLYQVQAAFTLLYFNNPGCQACEETTAYLKNSPLVHHLLKKGMLSILTVYPDEDIKEWKGHQQEIPDTWINGWDHKQVLNKKQLYDLKAIPSLYLLDRDKKVLLKDAPVQAVGEYLNRTIETIY